ncbi:type II secretion system protein [Deltaproteobacteria bacterium TL4]
MLVQNRTKRRRGGFSLVEIVIAVAVIGIMSAAAVPLIKGTMDKSKLNRAKSELESLKGAINAAITDNYGEEPTTWGVGADISGHPTITKYFQATTDPWGDASYYATFDGTNVKFGCLSTSTCGIQLAASANTLFSQIVTWQ